MPVLIDALVETRRVLKPGSVDVEGMRLEVLTRRPGSDEVLLDLVNYGTVIPLGFFSAAKLVALGNLLVDIAYVMREEDPWQ
jgi:hypothetical protein